MLIGYINLNPGPLITTDNKNMWDALLFRNWNLSSNWIKYKITFDGYDTNNGDKQLMVTIETSVT